MMTAAEHRPTAWLKRWGFFLAVLPGVLVSAGCAGRAPISCQGPFTMVYDAAEDSLGLEPFQALTASQQASRRQQARRYLREAGGSGRADHRITALTNAAGLTPDDPDIWLRLAGVWRWLGDYIHTDICLDNAATAVRSLDSGSALLAERGAGYRETAALQTALQRAWLHYDRAEWREGLPWARAALQVEHGNRSALRIRGLLEAILGTRGMAHEIAGDLRRKDVFSTDIAWIMSNLETAEGRLREAFNYCIDLRPDTQQASECYRDMGRTAERLGEWGYARKWYRESAAALPFRGISCLTELMSPRISEAGGRDPLPFWIAFDRYYVTGSLSAYLAYAYGRFEAAENAAERETWGGLVVNAAGICLRLEMERPDARRARGMVYAGTGHTDRALEDLQTAAEEFAAVGRPDPTLEAEIGRLLLRQEDHRGAISHLGRALEIQPDAARSWSDMGLSLILAGDTEGAEKALSRAIELDPGLVTAWYNRGLMHLHAGEMDAAEADLKEAARLAPDNTDVGRLLQQVMRQSRQSPRD